MEVRKQDIPNKVKDVNEKKYEIIYVVETCLMLCYFFLFMFTFTYGSKFSFIILHLILWVQYFVFHSKLII